MGTKGSFWVGNPENPARSNWLGMKKISGYPRTHSSRSNSLNFGGVTTKNQFKRRVKEIQRGTTNFVSPTSALYKVEQLHFCDHLPNEVNYTYAWFGGKVQIQKFNQGWKEWGDRTPWTGPSRGPIRIIERRPVREIRARELLNEDPPEDRGYRGDPHDDPF